MSFSDKFGGRLVCTALTDQCCTGNGIITDDLANALGCEITKAKETTTYSTAGGDFVSRYEISIKDAMLPCMSTTRTFDVVLNVMPKEASIDATYGVIMGQDSMRALGIDTSVLSSTITWNNIMIPMVPRGYWNRDSIMLNGEMLSQSPNFDEVEVPDRILVNQANGPSYTSNIVPSAKESRVQ